MERGNFDGERAGFRGHAIRRKYSQDRTSKGCCHGNQSWDSIAITGFVRTIARQLVMERGFSGRPTECIADTLHIEDVGIATIFLAF